MKSLSWLIAHPDYFALTAHRGASFEFPENTLLSMKKACEAGADFIEFDIRESSDSVPVILHDRSIDRTSNGTGLPSEYTLAQLKKFNFSYYMDGRRRTAPAYDSVSIPTFEEILDTFHDKVMMNIQVYVNSPKAISEVCRLYKQYDMYDKGYFTIDLTAIDAVLALDRNIALCPTPPMKERSLPEKLLSCKNKYNCFFAQPVREYSSQETYAYIRQLNMRSNVFFTDKVDEMEQLRSMGAQGVLTNNIHLLAQHLHRTPQANS